MKIRAPVNLLRAWASPQPAEKTLETTPPVMSWLRRMFDARYRRALAAEGAGEWRRAAALWAEADEPRRAADALLHLASRGGSLEARLEAWHDALRFLPDDGERREVHAKMGLAVLEDARVRGATSAEEKRRLAEAAARLEDADRPSEAAEAYAILGRTEDQARCLQAAGEVEKLEALLDQAAARDQQRGALRRLLAEHEMALKYGARLEARAALREAARVAPHDRSVGELLRRLEARIPPRSRVRIVIDGRRVSLVGRLPAVLGRADCEVPIRGTGVSRRHAEISLEGGKLLLRDLDSRNGTLVGGVPIANAIALSGATEVGLGDDVTLEVVPSGHAVSILVKGGLDRGERIVLGEGALRVEGLAARFSFDDGWAVLAADPGVELALDGQTCALPVHLLVGDRLDVGGVEVEVIE